MVPVVKVPPPLLLIVRPNTTVPTYILLLLYGIDDDIFDAYVSSEKFTNDNNVSVSI